MNFAPDTPAAIVLELLVTADSLAVQNDVSDKDRREIERTMKDKVLEVARFPEIVFASRQVSGMKLGETLYVTENRRRFFLHGVTRHAIVSANVIPGDDKLRAMR